VCVADVPWQRREPRQGDEQGEGSGAATTSGGARDGRRAREVDSQDRDRDGGEVTGSEGRPGGNSREPRPDQPTSSEPDDHGVQCHHREQRQAEVDVRLGRQPADDRRRVEQGHRRGARRAPERTARQGMHRSGGAEPHSERHELRREITPMGRGQDEQHRHQRGAGGEPEIRRERQAPLFEIAGDGRQLVVEGVETGWGMKRADQVGHGEDRHHGVESRADPPPRPGRRLPCRSFVVTPAPGAEQQDRHGLEREDRQRPEPAGEAEPHPGEPQSGQADRDGDRKTLGGVAVVEAQPGRDAVPQHEGRPEQEHEAPERGEKIEERLGGWAHPGFLL